MAGLPTWTAFSGYRNSAPYPGSGVKTFGEPATSALLWRELMMEASVASIGRRLFPGTLAQKNRLWREFRSYVRQAREYDEAAATVPGTSAALLLYYSALNLAKAELLTSNPGAISGQTIRHGLRYSPTAAKTISGDNVVVDQGVFPLLYQKRLGIALRLNTRLSVKRLTSNIPELGTELTATGFAQGHVTRLLHVIATNGPLMWALIGLDNVDAITQSRVSNALLRTHFQQVVPPPGVDWRPVFGISRRFPHERQWLFEGRSKHTSQPIGPGSYSSSDFTVVSNATWTVLRDMLDDGSDGQSDALLCASLLGSRMFPMPAALARYALMFYVSSLVRYKPEQVDPVLHPDQHWLLAAFVDQARTYLLRSALFGIRGYRHMFYEEGSFRA